MSSALISDKRKGWRLHSPLTERKSPRCISHQRLKSSFNFYEVQPTFGCTSFKHTVELVYLSRDQRLNLLLFWQCLALFFSSSWPVAPWCQRHIAWAMMHSFVVAKYPIRKIVVLTMFKLSDHQKTVACKSALILLMQALSRWCPRHGIVSGTELSYRTC